MAEILSNIVKIIYHSLIIALLGKLQNDSKGDFDCNNSSTWRNYSQQRIVHFGCQDIQPVNHICLEEKQLSQT